MLQKLNQRIQGVFAWIIISVIAVTFALFGVEYYMQSRQTIPSLVEVNGETITAQEFETNYQRLIRTLNPAELTKESEVKRKKALSEEMVRKTLALQSAVKNGFSISTSEVQSAIASIAQFQQDGHFSSDRYRQLLSNAYFTPASFQKDVQQNLLLNQQRFAIEKTDFVLPYELSSFARLLYQTRDYSYVVIPVQSFLQSTTVDAKAIEIYYKEHQKEFQTPEQVQVEYVKLSMPELRHTIALKEGDVQRFYEENKVNYTTPAKWQVAHLFIAVPEKASLALRKSKEEKAEKIAKALQKSPEKFDDYLKKESDDKFSLPNKGVLPPIVAGQSPFGKNLIGYTDIGKVTNPIHTPKGYEIFKILGYEAPVLKPLGEVKPLIEEQLKLEQSQGLYSQALEQLSELVYQTPDTLKPAAQALNLTIKRSPLISRSGSESGLFKNPRVIQAVFNKEVFQEGNNSEPIQIDNDSVVVLRIVQRKPAREQSLPEVRSKIEAQLRLQMAVAEAKKVGESLLVSTGKPDVLHKTMETNHLSWHTVMKAKRFGETGPDEINEIAFKIPKVDEMKSKSLANGDFLVVQLKRIDEGDVAKLKPEEEVAIKKELGALNEKIIYALYMQALAKQAKVHWPQK